MGMECLVLIMFGIGFRNVINGCRFSEMCEPCPGVLCMQACPGPESMAKSVIYPGVWCMQILILLSVSKDLFNTYPAISSMQILVLTPKAPPLVFPYGAAS